MRTLYESILDSDKESAEKVGNALFFPYFAECFVKVFGKVDRDIVNLDKRRGAPQILGKIKFNNWKFTSLYNNRFRNKIQDMIDMLEKKYPTMQWSLEYRPIHLTQDIWKIEYYIYFKIHDYEFNWHVNLIHESKTIKKIFVYSLHTRATKNKELLKIIDDNI